MHTKELVFTLILLTQACSPYLAQTSSPVQPDDAPGILQRLQERAGEAKAKMQEMGGSVFGFVGTYYEDHVQPLMDSYSKWASNFQSSVWEKVQTTVENYMPKKAN